MVMGAACLLGGALVGSIMGRTYKINKSAMQKPTKVDAISGYQRSKNDGVTCPFLNDIFTSYTLSVPLLTFK